MKHLALLCTLHADGPATAAVLRRDGCEGLSALLEYEARDLARLLDWDDARAERFLREGLELSERLDEGLLESAEEGLRPARAELTDPADEDVDEEWDEEDVDDGSVQEVLDHWRELDDEDPPTAADPGFVLPRPEPRTALTALAVDGLEPALLRRLAEADVRDAEELVELSPLDLATRLGIGVTRVLRLQFLVRRALSADAAEPHHAAAEI